MSITRSYNKHTGIYYAYETTYEWSDQLQKKVQHKRCIGKYDPETGEIVSTGKRGRPVKQTIIPKLEDASKNCCREPGEVLSAVEDLYNTSKSIAAAMSKAAKEMDKLCESIEALTMQLGMEN